MSDSTYRTAVTAGDSPAPQTTPDTPKDKGVTQVPTSVEPPYTEYEKKTGKPYAVEYFDLGQYWNTGELYSKEVDSISTYINHLVETGEINNTLDSVQDKLKSIERMINVKSDARKATRVGMVAAHIEFLMKADNIKKTAAKYGMI